MTITVSRGDRRVRQWAKSDDLTEDRRDPEGKADRRKDEGFRQDIWSIGNFVCMSTFTKIITALRKAECVNCDGRFGPVEHGICDDCFTHRLEEPLFKDARP